MRATECTKERYRCGRGDWGGGESCKTHFSSHRRQKECFGQQPDLYQKINQFAAAVDSHLYTGPGQIN